MTTSLFVIRTNGLGYWDDKTEKGKYFIFESEMKFPAYK